MIQLKKELNSLVNDLKNYPKKSNQLDYVVSRRRREVQLLELDLGMEFDRICEKYNLKYVLDAGSLLGCCRNQGFIPWDDDIDVKMSREDYEKFRLIVNNEIDHTKYYFQDIYDMTYTLVYCRLRLLNTHLCGNSNKKSYDSKRDGIFIDILPCDWVPENIKEYNEYLNTIRELQKDYKRLFFPNRLIVSNKRYIRIPYERQEEGINILEKYNKEITKYNNQKDKSNLILNCSGTIILNNLRITNTQLFNDRILKEFEGVKFWIPRDFNTTLVDIYGKDWKTPYIGQLHHHFTRFDTGDGKLIHL